MNSAEKAGIILQKKNHIRNISKEIPEKKKIILLSPFKLCTKIPTYVAIYLRAKARELGQPDLVGGIPAHSRGLEPDSLEGPFQLKLSIHLY